MLAIDSWKWPVPKGQETCLMFGLYHCIIFYFNPGDKGVVAVTTIKFAFRSVWSTSIQISLQDTVLNSEFTEPQKLAKLHSHFL